MKGKNIPGLKTLLFPGRSFVSGVTGKAAAGRGGFAVGFPLIWRQQEEFSPDAETMPRTEGHIVPLPFGSNYLHVT